MTVSVEQNALALALFIFLRNFAQVWGVTIGGSILQNQLQKRLSTELISRMPDGTAISYAAIPIIPSLPEPLRTEVREGFANSLKIVWYVMTGIAAIGFVSSLMMKGLPLHTTVNEQWTLEKEEQGANRANQA